jgi:hypothetical protein
LSPAAAAAGEAAGVAAETGVAAARLAFAFDAFVEFTELVLSPAPHATSAETQARQRARVR